MEAKKDKLINLMTKTKKNLDRLAEKQKEIVSEIATCQRIIRECEMSLVLINKIDTIQDVGEDLDDIIIEDKLGVVDGFDEKFSHLINEQLLKIKIQAGKQAMNLFKKEEIEKIKQKAVEEYLASKE